MKHLILDAKAPAQYLRDTQLIYSLLDHLPTIISMTKIAPPYVFPFHGAKEEDWGVTGLVLIAESTIIIHTFVERGSFNMDVFSCKDFNEATALGFIIRGLHATAEKYQTIRRD